MTLKPAVLQQYASIQGSQAILRLVDDEDVVDFWEDLVASYDYRHSLLYCKTILVISLQGCL